MGASRQHPANPELGRGKGEWGWQSGHLRAKRWDLREQGKSKGKKVRSIQMENKGEKKETKNCYDKFFRPRITNSCFRSTWRNHSLMRDAVCISTKLVRT